MAIEKKNRQLCAIVFSDITGYTALMQKDEAASLLLLERYQKCHEELSKKHNGEIVQYYGDACLMIFPSVVEALKCCHSLQMAFRESPQVPVRVGVHLGDIVFTNDNVFGDAVNVASRVESMGVPGAILFSETVQKNLTSHPEFTYKSVGSFEFKNVEDPLEVFALTNDGLPVPRKEEMKGKLKSKKAPSKNRRLFMILPLILGIFALTAWYFMSDTEPPPTESTLITPIPTRPGTISSDPTILSFDVGTFVDERDNQQYQWVEYANGQKWMAENLNYKTSATPCYGDKNQCSEFGRLYTWNEANRRCPNGWRLPTDEEWTSLIQIAGGSTAAYASLMSNETSGFNAKLGGSKDENGDYNFINDAGIYWTNATANDPSKARLITFSSNLKEVMLLSESKDMAYSCRCIEDQSSRKSLPKPSITKLAPETKGVKEREVNDPFHIRGSGSLSLITSEGIPIEFDILEDVFSGRSADLKIGAKKKKPSKYQISTVHSGDGYVYELKFGHPTQLIEVQSADQFTSNIDADLKIGKKKGKEEDEETNKAVIISSEPIDLRSVNSNIESAKTLEDSYAMLKNHFGSQLKSDLKSNIFHESGTLSYTVRNDEVLLIILSPL